ncbi:MAG: leucine-rich repeat domain-containing protein [Paludibacteraceae bacterium]|nr:leucine-rich repeat domain-containing protein [Paludibacteraceae bacterium]
MRKKFFTFLLALAASVGMSWATPAVAVNGKLPGAFSVDESTVVYFSQGNLKYTKSTDKFEFMTNQYDMVETNGDVGDNYASQDVISLFGWATSNLNTPVANTNYLPTNTNTTFASYGSGITTANVNWATAHANYDWGANTADLGTGWRTLTTAEWQYLFNSRTGDKAATVNGTGNRTYTKATINTDGTAVTGIILFPDGGTFAASEFTAVGSPNTADVDFTTTCTTAQWTALQTKGCVFLPAAGYRSGTSVDFVGDGGYYWSSTSSYYHSSYYAIAYGPSFEAGIYLGSNVEPNGGGERYTGRSVRLVSETAPAPPLQVSEFEVPGSWNGDYDTELTASDFPGFVAASAAEAQAWSGVPESGWSYLIYAFEDNEAKVCEFEDGAFYGLVTESVRDDIYFRFEQGYPIYYTGTAPVYTLLSTITLQLENSQFVENHTNPNVASIGKSCNVTYAQYADYIAWKTDPWSSGEMLLVMPKAGYTITKVVFTRDNNPSNKVIVTSAPFTASVTNSDNISQIEVYGEAETPAAPVVVASWTSNECNVVLTNDGKLTVSKNEYNGEMEDMNSYQSSKWRCFSDLITSVEIQEGVTRIGDYAFYNMQNISSVSFPNSLTSIGDGAFMDCSITGDLVLPENLESIGEKCFSMVPKSLSTISVPASVTSIGMCAFENKGASNKTSTNVLTAINVAAANPNYCSVDGILYSKDMTTLIAYPAGKTNTEYEIPATVTEIKYNALYSCVNITDLTIPAATSVIEENGGSNIVAFSGCYGLENIHNNATTPQSIYRVLSYWEDQGQDQINLYVPSGLGTTYEAAAGWQELNIIDSSTPAPTTEDVATNQDPLSPSMHYSTFFHSTQNYALTGDGTQAFIAKINGGDFVLTKIADGTQVIPANTAVIFCKSGSSDPIVLSPTDEAGVSVNPENNSLRGVDDATTLESLSIEQNNCYVLSGTAEHGVGFYKINTTTLLAHKAFYAHVAAGAPPRRIRFVYSEANEATGMENVQGDNVQSTKVLEDGVIYIERNGVRYNAQGQMVK